MERLGLRSVRRQGFSRHVQTESKSRASNQRSLKPKVYEKSPDRRISPGASRYATKIKNQKSKRFHTRGRGYDIHGGKNRASPEFVQLGRAICSTRFAYASDLAIGAPDSQSLDISVSGLKELNSPYLLARSALYSSLYHTLYFDSIGYSLIY
jgi:hypothetical protein